MAVYYPDTCDPLIPDHACSNCLDRENGRVRGVFFKKKSYEFADPTSVAEWEAAVLSGDVIIVPYTHGDFDGGTPNEGQGYGDQVSTYLNSAYVLNFFDPDLVDNRNFYNEIKKSRNYEVGFRTETVLWFLSGTAVILPKSPVADDLNSEVVWNVQVKATSSDEPSMYEAEDVISEIFQCFAIEA